MLKPSSLENQKICLTGATGFLGGHLTPILQEKGAKLRILARKNQPEPNNAEIIQGDCLDYSAIKSLLDGQDIFIHMAALLFGSGWQDYLSANTTVIRNIIQALKNLDPNRRPKKIIMISSLSAAGPCAKLPGKKETETPAPVSAYGWSKLCCEDALAAAPVDTLTILRPPIIYGSGDRGLLQLFRSLQKGFGASPGAFREFPVSIIHARDAALAIAIACEKNLPGVYHLSDGKVYTMDKFCHAAASAMGKSSCIVLHVPLPIMNLSARISSGSHKFLEKMAKMLGKTPPPPPHWNADKFMEAKQEGWLADSSLFEEKTGFMPQMDLALGMAETITGYRARGWL